MHWRIPVTRWSTWSPEVEVGQTSGPRAAAPELTFVDPMLRRRLGRLAKMALWVAHECAHDRPRARLVFASRHGELSRSLNLLRDLARDEPLSPTAFSLSVHNAAAGIFSILRQDTSPATAIAAGEETFGMALLEAAAQLQADPALPVLLVYADEPVPEDYGAFAAPGESPHALALLLETGAAREITCSMTTGTGPASAGPQSLAFLEGCAHGSEASWSNGQRTWIWQH